MFDLIVMYMASFDVILGVDWLTTFQVTIDCSKRRIFMKAVGQEGVSFTFPLQRKMERKDLLSQLASLARGEVLALTSGEMPRVVCEFLEVFLGNLVSLPPERKVEFAIECFLGTTPISIALHRMVPIELVELKK